MSKWPEAEKAKLVWHYLLFNKQIVSSRTKKQLSEVQDKVVERIQIIEDSEEFIPHKSALCDWCDFQEICPLWKHPKKVEKLEENKYKKDPGVKMVTAYTKLEEEKKELKEKIASIEHEQAKIAEAAIELAEREDIRVIDGPGKRLVITLKEELAAPTRKDDQEKWTRLRQFLIENDKYRDVSTVNNSMLIKTMKTWPRDVLARIKDFLVKKKIRKVDLKNKN